MALRTCAGALFGASLLLCLWGNSWGTPEFWHPDELTPRAMRMASERDLNPHFYAYGTFHYYVLIAGAIAPVKAVELLVDRRPAADGAARDAWWTRHRTRVIRASRAVSALFTAATVVVTAIVGTELFGTGTGVLAALFLTVSMGTVLVGHYATVEAAANFWYWLACLGGLLIWRRGARRWYILAAVSAALAIATKIDRMVIILPLLAAHVLRGRRGDTNRFLGSVALAGCTLLAATPVVLVSPFEFLDGFSHELFFNSLRQAPDAAYLQFPRHLLGSLGWPLFAVSVWGLSSGLWLAAHGIRRAAFGYLALAMLVYPLVFSGRLIRYNYVTLLVPGLALLAACGCTRAARWWAPRSRLPVWGSVAAVLVASLLYTVTLDLEFSHDPRWSASAWIASNIPPGASVDISPYGPRIPARTYRVRVVETEPEYAGSLWTAQKGLETSAGYQRVRRAIRAVELWAGQTLGTHVRSGEYVGWFDRAVAHSRVIVAAGRGADPDWVILSFKDPAAYRHRLAALSDRRSGYRLAAHFHYWPPTGLAPSSHVTQVNPQVFIFRRVRPAGAPATS